VRTLLVTGPGGSGRTTIAAATAAAEARRGRRVLLLPAHRGGAFSGDLPGVRVIRTDPAASFRADALDVQGRLGSVLDLLGATPLDPEELTELPGTGTFALLRALRDAASEDVWDLVVADLPPVHEALAALALPEQLRRYLGRLVPAERQAARALRPVLAQLAGVPMPGERLYEAAGRADAELAAAQAVIEDAGTTVRLVVEPGAHAADAIRHARTGLALYGHRLEAVIANRLLPAASPDPWLTELSAQQHKELRALRAELAQTPLHAVPHLGREPLSADDLAELALPEQALPELPGPAGDRRAKPWTVEDRLASDGHFLWRLPLPGATRERLDLVRRGDELVIDTEGFRRILPLPSALRRCTVAGASLRDGALSVRFEPDPSLWPR
jgi:arsenite-transporting ATPase